MRKQILIPGIVVVIICVGWLLFKTTQPQKVVSNNPSETLTIPSGEIAEKKVAESNGQMQNPSSLPPARQVTVEPSTTRVGTNTIDSRLLANWQAPIDFYGKIVDENTNPVEGASIHFRWSEIPAADGMRTTDTQSDSEGLFSLQGKRGASLTVSFSKSGYYSSGRGEKTFSYALPTAITPDPLDPVVFNLRKKGAPEPLVAMKRNYRIPRDGTPVSIDLATGASTTGQNGNLVVRCWTKDQGKRSGEKYEWRCIVTIPGGGIVATKEEFAFKAPEGGYTASTEIAMPADIPNWTSDVDLRFFYRLADGRYGRMTFSMIAGGQHFCMVDSVMNPSGSRNLEPPN